MLWTSLATGPRRQLLWGLRSALGAIDLVMQKTPMSRLGAGTFAVLKAVALFGSRDDAAKLAFSDLLPMGDFLRPNDGLLWSRNCGGSALPIRPANCWSGPAPAIRTKARSWRS